MGKQQLSSIQGMGNWIMLAVDNIKIKYSLEGYLPDYPPHLISNEEMCEAFLPRYDNEISSSNPQVWSYFYDNYPLINESLRLEYNSLINAIKYHFVRFLTDVDSFYQDLPNWVYSYMLGHVITQSSSEEDRHYFLTGIGKDNIDDSITSQIQEYTYTVSQKWCNKLSKSDKLANKDSILNGLSEETKAKIESEFNNWGVVFEDNGNIVTRPPSMFGEQNIIKLIRLNEVI